MKSSLLLLTTLVLLKTATFAEAPKPIAAALQPFVDHQDAAGMVTIVADKDKVLDVTAVGSADIASKKPMKSDDLFWIASMSKAMTAAGLMVLVDEGKVNIEDPVEKYLPEFKGQMVVAEKAGDHMLLKKPVHPITLKNVLSHTSGLPFRSAIEQPTLDLFPLALRVRSYSMLPLDFEPDSKYQYSNAGINTAGRIIEVVSGMSYEDFMQKRLFEPLGMKDTTFWPTAAQFARLAKSYKHEKDKPELVETIVTQCQYPLDDHTRQPMPAGGLFSTVEDTAKFCQMLLRGGELNGHRVLSEAAVKTMTSRQTPDSLKNSYGFGLQVTPDTFGHGGAYSTDMSVDKKNGLVMIFMVQNAGGKNDEFKKIVPAFHKAALEAFGKK